MTVSPCDALRNIKTVDVIVQTLFKGNVIFCYLRRPYEKNLFIPVIIITD